MSPVALAMSRRGAYHVYVVECRDGTYYTGITNHLAARIKLHNAGRGAKYVRGRQPARLVYAKKCRNYPSALRAEHALKRLSRKQKEALIRAQG